MPIRPATSSDRSALAQLCATAFFDEDLFGRVMHPHRHEYPGDVVLFWHAWIRDLWFDWRNKTFVAYTNEEKDNGKEKIVGVAVWQRQGEGAKKMELNTLDPRRLALLISKLQSRFTSLVYSNRALDPTTATLLIDSLPYSKHHWAGERADNWYLSLCAVDPAYQGQGYGRELVEWGLKEAEKENIHASVMSSEGKEGFYLRCGFDEIVGNATEGEGNPLRGVKGGSILFKFPKRL